VRVLDTQNIGAVAPLLTLNETAEILRVSKAWVERRIRERRLRAVKLGGLTRVVKTDLDAFIASASDAVYRGKAA
jgi:excisionase family DNA binding protein